MLIDDTKLSAYLDGELDQEGRAQVEAALASDPLLVARMARHRKLRERLAGAYDPVLQEVVPERLVAGVGAGGSDNVVRLADRRAPPAPKPIRIKLKWPSWGTVAAVFVGGLALGFGAAHETGGPLGVRADGVVVARGDLVRALNEERGGEGRAVRMGVSFKARDQRYCRTFEVDTRRLAGIACREPGGWVARMTTETPLQGKGAESYRTAGSNIPLSVVEAATSMMAGEPLDASAEALARARGWKD